MFGYLPNARFAIRGIFVHSFRSAGSIEARCIARKLPVYSFNSQVYELTARGEFNFFAFGIGETYKRLRRWSPHLAIGVGVAIGGSGRQDMRGRDATHGFRREIQAARAP